MPSTSLATATEAVASHEMTIFVRLCQREASDRFMARVHPQATVEALQRFLFEQWRITKNPLMEVPLSDHIFSFQGRILRHDANLDIYYITDQDTLYIRFPALGPISNPWAMSSSELRDELQTRRAYQPNLRPEQLMHKLQNLIQRESRLQRLQRATKRGLVDDVRAITQELASLDRDANNQTTVTDVAALARPKSIVWPTPPCAHRTVFFSVAELERRYQHIPRDVLEPALLILDADRDWVFARHNALQKASFDYKYMAFDKDFLDMLLFKEEAHLIFWFQPDKSFEKLSTFLTKVVDPVTAKPYLPMMLAPSKWLTLGGQDGWEGRTRRDGRRKTTRVIPRYTTSVQRIVTNLQSKSFDVLAVKEMLVQANPMLLFADDILAK
ncbi:Aste57867_14264 [Aphanomyces stellatus]|uniref:Aste57867_14264 protein n=1 Tax=Aphanomyces stellatus TaxID=120398 RepID=A0A485L0A2_9STRA|nr:hypothetical protein As57867_014213 [Aphanomyces stellatus]VFT91089.1 Aste57867_14264 [Aphanomyces stellatus]